ncbi:MAG: hypothetical protein EXS37_15220 [Opitutus sp.]|nr:hypothetical protein [Opitutus sp.]
MPAPFAEELEKALESLVGDDYRGVVALKGMDIEEAAIEVGYPADEGGKLGVEFAFGFTLAEAVME